MKNGKKPTVAERRYLQSINLNSDWLISKKLTDKWVIVHRFTGQVKEIPAP